MDAEVDGIRDVDVPASIGRHGLGELKLPVARASASPFGQEGAASGELLDAAVVGIGNVDVATRVRRYAEGGIELSVA